MERYYIVAILNAMAKALDIPSGHNATAAKNEFLVYRKNLPEEDVQTKSCVDRYIELIDTLLRALDNNNNEDYECVRCGMYATISEFAKHISDEIESEYF